MNQINRNSKLPFYQQLYEMLYGKIVRGEWKPGDLIPGEQELMEQYRVSRNTARKVLDMLVNNGLIYRQRGKGSFVSHPTIEEAMSRIISFTEDMRQRGFEPGTQVLEARLVPAASAIAEKLEIPPEEELVKIVRLRLADREPMSVEESFLVHRFCRGILQHDYTSAPLRQILSRDYDIHLVRARQSIRAIPATEPLAQQLAVALEAPLLAIERVSFSQADIPIEFLRIYYRGDRYSLAGELHE
jgi:GntR family transcriptional regulator